MHLMDSHSNLPLVSYAQNREDLYLWALVGHRTPGTYVDVGCNHERLHSVTRLFYEQGWSGVSIDANGHFEREYRHRSRDRFVEAGVGEAPGNHIFRHYPNQDGLSTFDSAIKSIHDGSGYVYRDVTVPIRTLDDILSEVGVSSIDFLKIDVEGFEPPVLRGLDLSKMRPAVIVVEASREADCQEILLPQRYRVEFFDGLNTYYVDGDIEDVAIHNYAQRVLHGGFSTDIEQRLRGEIELLRSGVETRSCAGRADPGTLTRPTSLDDVRELLRRGGGFVGQFMRHRSGQAK